jgi:hypothetical protein
VDVGLLLLDGINLWGQVPCVWRSGGLSRAILLQEGQKDSAVSLICDAASVVAFPCQARHCYQGLLEWLRACKVQQLSRGDFQV